MMGLTLTLIKMVLQKTRICNISALSIHGSWMKTLPLFIEVLIDNIYSHDCVEDI